MNRPNAHAKGDYERAASLRRMFEIVRLLAQQPQTLDELAHALGVSQRTIRRHLYVLQAAGVIITRTVNRADAVCNADEDDEWPQAAGRRCCLTLDAASWSELLQLPPA